MSDSTHRADAATPLDRRRQLRDALASERLLQFPGAFSPLVARMVGDYAFDGVYVSGAALAADLALPDIGLTTLSEVVTRSQQIARATPLPVLVDADTGFGEPANVARTIDLLEATEVAGCHLEDQVNPKRCGHLDSKTVVEPHVMVRRVRAAVLARRDPNFIVCARTDARAIEGIDSAIDRAKAYVDAGADMIFPEALADESEFAKFRSAIDVPLIANMTEFGKSPLLDATTLHDLGFNVVIWPVTSLRVAMGAVEELLAELERTGTQSSFVPRMQTRARLYELIDYEGYGAFDHSIFNFEIPGGINDE